MRLFGGLAVMAFGLAIGSGASASPGHGHSFSFGERPRFEHRGGFSFEPGNLLVSRSVYDNNPANVQVGEPLPPGCVSECATATTDGVYPYVWDNDFADESFGITSKIFLDQLTPSGSFVNSLEVPNSSERGVSPTQDQMVTSFSSKSELALNLSTDGRDVTFMGYLAPTDTVDVSNANTPGVIDPTNPVPGPTIASWRRSTVAAGSTSPRRTPTAAITAGLRSSTAKTGEEVLYTAGNAGNGANPQPNGIIVGAGAQILDPQFEPEAAQSPGPPTPLGSFNITQLGDKADKIGKDTNFRGMTIFNHVLYYTKGSGSNGVNTVYFVDTTGHACPSGVGLPAPNAPLPRSPLAYEPSLLQTSGLQPNNMCILKGFPTALLSRSPASPVRDLVREPRHALRRRRG